MSTRRRSQTQTKHTTAAGVSSTIYQRTESLTVSLSLSLLSLVLSLVSMVTACNSFLADQGESLEQLLYTGVPDRDIRTRLCIEDSGVCSSLWSDEDEERKRDRSPEESEREAAEQKRAGREAAKAEKARKKAEKAEKARKAKEAKAKKAKKASAPVPDRDQNEPKEEL